eukprot:scaffold15703_cov125-Skeletonema_dohrnii-CCMP3373.AAC.2
MDASRRADLEQARLRLCKNQYEFFVTEYDSRYSYNCNDEIVDGQEGTRVRHSSNSNEGYFIPDAGVNGVGEVCPCETEQSDACGCRHFCAKRVHRKEPVFCLENIHKRHLFQIELPVEKASSVQVDETLLLEDNPNALPAAVPAAAPAAAPAAHNDNLVFMSPSKLASSTTSAPRPPPSIATDNFLSRKPCNVGFNKLNDAGSRLAKVASSHSNAIQHVALSLITNLTSMLEKMDFDSDEYKNTPYAVMAKQISATLKDDEATLEPGMPKAKNHDANGVCIYRKGSEKCTTTGNKRKPVSCGFCRGDRRTHPEHRTMSSCGVKRSLGDCVKVTAESKNEIGDKLMKICNGAEGFGDVSNRRAFNDHLYVSNVPKDTKRIQIKAYCVKDGMRYLLCALLDDRGWPLDVKHGTETTTDENVFLSQVGAVQCIEKCDYIFYDKIKVPREEEDDILCDDGTYLGDCENEVGTEGRAKRSAAVAGRKRIRNAMNNTRR